MRKVSYIDIGISPKKVLPVEKRPYALSSTETILWQSPEAAMPGKKHMIALILPGTHEMCTAYKQPGGWSHDKEGVLKVEFEPNWVAWPPSYPPYPPDVAA